jgi:hypothetical protein
MTESGSHHANPYAPPWPQAGQYPANPAHPYPAYGAPGPYPGQPPYGPPATKPPLRHVALTRSLAGASIVVYLMIAVFGFLTFATVTRNGESEGSTFNGWAHWTSQGEGLPLTDGSHAVIFPGVLLPLLILFPTALSSILIMCNVGRRPFAAVTILFGVIATAVATLAVVNPSVVVGTFDDSSATFIDANYSFSPGPSAILNVVIGIVIVMLAIGVIAFGGKART